VPCELEEQFVQWGETWEEVAGKVPAGWVAQEGETFASWVLLY